MQIKHSLIMQDISSAISKQMKVSFFYHSTNSTNYIVSPYYLIQVANEYYLIAHDSKNDIAGKHYLSNFKVSSIEDLKIFNEEAISIEEMQEFPAYKEDRLKMYTRDITSEHVDRLKKNLSFDYMPKDRALKEFPLHKYIVENLTNI